ncbi:hypothetical protein MIT9_P0765 [Methylomarinovum caldicuralii]|uniref:Uncharacterized protein n=1 Tax=Methylomarinovum caldicuralii TaxID=438856 RepID=A0AAU9CTG2_9GAMM|nr:hypothetical protein [Methylomarinovum caldicuralii]BCX81187.1 hypothetical protein MIT9_P0765 [Methylomarinovum caldicuralii]
MLGVIVLFLLALTGLRFRHPVLLAGGYGLLTGLYSLTFDDFQGAGLRAMMATAFGLFFFLALDRTRHHWGYWLATLVICLTAWYFWPWLVM